MEMPDEEIIMELPPPLLPLLLLAQTSPSLPDLPKSSPWGPS
jgi:hypothetical protein